MHPVCADFAMLMINEGKDSSNSETYAAVDAKDFLTLGGAPWFDFGA